METKTQPTLSKKVEEVAGMNLNHRRSSIQIIADMLHTGENGAGKTKIMYNSNLSYTQIQKYMTFLLTHGFIAEIHVGNPKITYQITDSGSKLLRSIESVTEMLGWLDE